MKKFAVLYTIIPEKPLRPLQDLEAAASPISPVSSIFIEAEDFDEATKFTEDYVVLKYGYKPSQVFIFLTTEVV